MSRIQIDGFTLFARPTQWGWRITGAQVQRLHRAGIWPALRTIMAVDVGGQLGHALLVGSDGSHGADITLADCRCRP